MSDPRVEMTEEQAEAYAMLESRLRSGLLEGSLKPDAVIDGLKKLAETARGMVNCDITPMIPGWADEESPIIQHIPCGMVDPAKLTTVNVSKIGEFVTAVEVFVDRAQKLPGAMNACMFDFYAKWQNWKYLPTNVSTIFFPNTIFRGRVRSMRYVCFLQRDGISWCKNEQPLRGSHPVTPEMAVVTS